jgi:hypothetical protein
MKKTVLGLGFVVAALTLLFGCGGGGGGGGTNTTTTTTTGNVTVSIMPSKITLKPGAATTFNASVSDGTNVTFTRTGGTIVGTGNSVSYTAPAAVGTYTVTATSVEKKTVSNSATVTVSTGVSGNTATISGTLGDNLGPLSNVAIQFFNAGGGVVGTATAVNGAYSASVPITAVSFNLVASTINKQNDYSEFFYQGVWYDPTISGCNAPLPTLSGNEVLPLGAIQMLSTQNPPPPPPNCGP